MKDSRISIFVMFYQDSIGLIKMINGYIMKFIGGGNNIP